MRITFLGHVGLFVETRHGSVLCDPWFNPAYFGAWFPYPRNDTLDPSAFARPDYLYVSHLHRDHFDPEWLAQHVDPSAQVLLPAFGVPHLERALRAVGFTRFVEAPPAQPIDLNGLEIAILACTQPADGPLGDSVIVIGDGETRIVNQNDARPGSRQELAALGPFDAQFVQFSGAIWYPVAYELPPDVKARLAADKRVNEMARARQYVEWAAASHVFPCAGPPAFLDDGLWDLNDVERDPTNIFPDQMTFLDELATNGVESGHLVVPGSVIELSGSRCSVTHPTPNAATEPFGATKRGYLERYRDHWWSWLEREHASWAEHPMSHKALVAALAEWLEPLLERAPITSAGIAGNVVFDFGGATRSRRPDGVVLDFVESKVRPWKGEPAVYRVSVARELVETLVARHETDWVNSLFLSCRFVAHRDGPFNEFVMTFFKALDVEKIDYVERRLADARPRDQWIDKDGWRIERFCPHRQADLAEYGTIDGAVLTCALHHWQFDLTTGRCLTSNDPSKHLRCRRIE